MSKFLTEFKTSTNELLERIRGHVQVTDALEYLIYLFFAKRISSQIESDIDKYTKVLKEQGLDDSEVKRRINNNGPDEFEYYLPEMHLWRNLDSALIEIPAELDLLLHELGRRNSGLIDVFSNINFQDEVNRNRVSFECFYDVYDFINKIDISEDSETESNEIAEAFKFLIYEIDRINGKFGGFEATPLTLTKLLSDIVKNETPDIASVYDPTCGTGMILLSLTNGVSNNPKLYGQEINSKAKNIAVMNMLISGVGINNFDIRQCNTLTEPQHEKDSFDAVIGNPPFSISWQPPAELSSDERFSEYRKLAPQSKADFAFVLDMLYHLKPNGIMAVILPLNTMSRRGAEATIREVLIDEKNVLEAVIALPPNMVSNTSIPTCIMVFKKNRQENESIIFIDASNDFQADVSKNLLRDEDIAKILNSLNEKSEIEHYCSEVTRDDIKNNEFNLNVSLYVEEYREVTIKSFEDFHKKINEYKGHQVVFRGLKDEDFDLKTSAGRMSVELTDIEDAEKSVFKQFKEQAIPHLGFEPRNDWEWLALAQHHGLPTRLLDWTQNPLVALYFAVEESTESNSAVYVYTDRENAVNISDYPNPLELSNDEPVRRYVPAHLTNRIIAQAGVFTVHHDVTSSFTSKNVDKIIIPNKIRNELKEQLYRYGIHRGTIYPGLDGLSAHIRWLSEQNDA